MSEHPNDSAPEHGAGHGADHDPEEEREAIDEVQRKLDAEADGDGLAAEAGRAEENGLSEG